MDSFEFNNVKAEKAQAMRGYNHRKLLKKLELFTALALLVWSSYYNYIPVAAAAKISADFIRHNVAVLGQPLHVFLAINILVVVISVLPSQKPAKQGLYDHYVTITNSPPRISTSTDNHKPAPEVSISGKENICADNELSPSVVQNTVDAAMATTTTTEVKGTEPVSPVQEESTVGEVKEYYRRTRSERLDRGKGNGQRELMRRSETLIKQTTSEAEKERRSSDMDYMSSEEFKKTIDIFIAAKKKNLIKENTIDLNLHDKECLALTLSEN